MDSLALARLPRWLLYGVAALLVVGLGGRALRAAFGEPDDCSRYCQALIQSKTHARVEAQAARDSLRMVALKQKVVYVTARREALDAVKALPPATITGTTITLPEGTFSVAAPVLAYITALQLAIPKLEAAVAKADRALAASDAARVASDSAAATQHAEDVAKLEAANAGKPGRLARAWDAVKAPLAFIGGAALGVLAGRAVR